MNVGVGVVTVITANHLSDVPVAVEVDQITTIAVLIDPIIGDLDSVGVDVGVGVIAVGVVEDIARGLITGPD